MLLKGKGRGEGGASMSRGVETEKREEKRKGKGTEKGDLYFLGRRCGKGREAGTGKG